jgi:peptide deformylase
MNLRQLRIIHYPDPRLRKRSKPLEKIDEDLTRLTVRMFELMYEVRGLGLAAPQVGLNWRMFVTNHTGQPENELVFINPEIVEVRGQIERDEGCLSVPEIYVPLKRAQWCRIRAVNLNGNPFEMEGEDLLARAWQHEMDHLNGVLIADRMSPTDRIVHRKQLKKLEDEFDREVPGKPAHRKARTY